MTNLTGDILIVDDETPNLQLLTQVLSDAGYRALPATSSSLMTKPRICNC
jgi:CheY-like chemotaxis protein